MDFFTNQDIARRNTKYLVLIFLVAVLLLIFLANIVVALCLWIASGKTHIDTSLPLFSLINWHVFGLVCLGVNVVIGLAIAYKWIQLSDGGKSVAEALGGSRLSPNTEDLQQRRMQNVVEEMALASGMPVPPVYLLAREQGINAFAAGNSPADAVIGITQGALDQFNREQLQGVIAHEFSHILNGDMRLNLRLIALLNGILFLGNCGRFLLRSTGYSSRSTRRSGGGRLLILGLAMAAIGWIGTFFGGLIKAAINRQREFLADASAVQFTRNPNGIADALKIIGGYSRGSRMIAADAEEASHLFISNALAGFAFFKTHPPIAERIRRLDSQWDGKMIQRQPIQPQGNGGQTHAAGHRPNVSPAAVLGAVLGQVASGGQKTPVSLAVPVPLMDKLREPLSAVALLYALLLDKDPDVREKQMAIIRDNAPLGSAQLCAVLTKEIDNIDPALRIVLIEKAMPALKSMSRNQYITLRKGLKRCIHADQKIDLFEWCLFQMVRHHLGAEYGDKRASRQHYKTVNELASHYVVVVSTFIHHCHLQPETAERAFTRGANTAGLYVAHLLPKAECTMEDFIKGVNAMADSYPLLKARLLKGLKHVIEFDRVITPMENELVTCIAAIMDSPLPRLSVSG